MGVYKSERWIHKKHIFELEEQIERQIFAGLNVTVTVIEKFRLSGQYNPQNFLETYRSSMELELRSYNMLEYNMFRQAQISFPGENDLHMILPDSVIAREKSDPDRISAEGFLRKMRNGLKGGT